MNFVSWTLLIAVLCLIAFTAYAVFTIDNQTEKICRAKGYDSYDRSKEICVSGNSYKKILIICEGFIPIKCKELKEHKGGNAT